MVIAIMIRSQIVHRVQTRNEQQQQPEKTQEMKLDYT